MNSPLKSLLAPGLEIEAVDIAVGAPRLDVVRLITSVLHERPDVTLRVLCAAPGDGVVPPSSLCEGMTLSHNLSMELAAAWKERLVSVFGSDVDGAPKTDNQQEAIIELADMVEEGRVEFAFFDRSLNFTRTLLLHTEQGPINLLAHGGFQPEALAQAGELRSLQRGDASRGVSEWFEKMWHDALDITPELLELLLDSWACQLLTPKEAYQKVLVEYFAEMLETEDPLADDNPMLEHLAEFQKHAYAHAKGILRRFGGVFISDVVGLGKTFIGLALLKHAVHIQHARPLIIAPPRLCDMWDELTLEYGVEKEILSNYQLEKLDRYQSRDLLLIDESHAFRNEGTQRYEQLMAYLRPDGQPSRRKVILLTATPQNNTCWDVYNQLQFFPDVYGKLPFDGEDLGEFFKRVEHGDADLASLMQYALVRRTRTFIKQEYPDATLPGVDENGNAIEEPIVFPERRDGEDMALRYSIQEAYDGLYDDVIETLKNLSYARYGLVDYLTEEASELARYQNLVRAGRSLRGLFKATVLKRCESSLEAFKATLSWLIATHQAFYTALTKQYRVVARPEHAGRRVDEMAVEDVLELFDASYPASDFEVDRLATDIKRDATRLQVLRNQIDQIPVEHDAKLQRLRDHLVEHSPVQHRTLLFTQYTDTAVYLYEQLKDLDMCVELITNRHGNQFDIMERFAPKAMSAEVDQERQIDLLISTDVLAEGVNLQDADTIVNYDLHWNPVRLIQRAGRIDRIGSENDEIFLFNFLPEVAIEKALGLEKVLRQRIQEIQEVFGEDGRILPAEHTIEESRVIDTYTGKALRDAEENESLDNLSHHLREAFAIKKRTADYRRLVNLRAGQRAILDEGHEISVVMGQAGWYKKFYAAYADELDHLADEQALGLLRKWAASETWVDSAIINSRLNEATRLVEREFEQSTRRLREKREQPKLTPAQTYIRERLISLRGKLGGDKERQEVDRMIAWIERGRYKILFDKQARLWRRNKLAAEAIRTEMRGWLRQYGEREAELPEPEIVVSVLGS